jgi:hypothetical protein
LNTFVASHTLPHAPTSQPAALLALGHEENLLNQGLSNPLRDLQPCLVSLKKTTEQHVYATTPPPTAPIHNQGAFLRNGQTDTGSADVDTSVQFTRRAQHQTNDSAPPSTTIKPPTQTSTGLRTTHHEPSDRNAVTRYSAANPLQTQNRTVDQIEFPQTLNCRAPEASQEHSEWTVASKKIKKAIRDTLEDDLKNGFIGNFVTYYNIFKTSPGCASVFRDFQNEHRLFILNCNARSENWMNAGNISIYVFEGQKPLLYINSWNKPLVDALENGLNDVSIVIDDEVIFKSDTIGLVREHANAARRGLGTTGWLSDLVTANAQDIYDLFNRIKDVQTKKSLRVQQESGFKPPLLGVF